MILDFTSEKSGQAARGNDLSASHAAGRQLAESITETRPHGKRGGKPLRGQAERIIARARTAPADSRAWLLDNTRLLQTAARQAFEFAGGVHRFPVALGSFGETPRIFQMAQVYLEDAHLHFTEDTCVAFLNGFQEVSTLEMGEIWGLKPTLQLVILGRLESADSTSWPELVTSLRHVGETAWKDLFESVSLVDRALGADPAGAYWRMDFASRDGYRNAIAGLAKHSARTEREVAEAAVELAREGLPVRDGSRAGARRSHVGYYLLDGGRHRLKSRIHYRAPLRARPQELALRFPTTFYLVGIEVLTFATVAFLISGVGTFTPRLIGLLLLLLPATQAAVDFMNHLVTHLVPPRALPKLDFSEGIPDDCATMVAVPTLLLNESQVRDLVLDLEIRFLANRDPNLYFALLTDLPDSDQPEDGQGRTGWRLPAN